MRAKQLMGVVARALMFATLALASAERAFATTMSFDGLACQTAFAGNIGGFTFSDAWTAQCKDSYLAEWGNSDFSSGTTAVGNRVSDDGSYVSITRAGNPFGFLSAQFSSFLIGDSFDYLTPMSASLLHIEGYLGDTIVNVFDIDFESLAVGFNTVNFLNLFAMVDELRFFSSFDLNVAYGPDYWLMDSFEFEELSAVPEPSELILLGSGLTLMAIALRRRGRTVRSL